METRFSKYVFTIVLVITLTLVLTSVGDSNDSLIQDNSPLPEKERSFVLSNPDFYLTVESDHGTPGGEGWYLDFSTVYASLDTDIVSDVPGVRYVFVSWSGDATGTNYASSDAITMDANKTATAVWKTQYYLDVQSDHGTTSGSGWYDSGTTAVAGLDTGTVSGGTGVQYVFTNWGGDATGAIYAASNSILMNSPKTATASWKTQYYLTVESDYGTTSGEGWKDAGVNIFASLDTGLVAGGTGVQFVFTNWSGDSTGTDYTASENILMNGPKTATAVWKTQYYLTVTSDHATPAGEGWHDAGSSLSAGLDTDIVSGGAGTRYVFTTWSGDATGSNYAASDTIVMDAPKTAIANWKTQYYLTVTSVHGTVSGDGWHDSGTTVYAGLDSGVVSGSTGVQYVFTSWSGDATGTDYAASDNILMNGPKTATAVWKTQYYLTVTSDHGTVSGDGWHDSGTTLYAGLDSGVVSGGTGVQYVFTNWGGDATGTTYAASDSILMNSPKTATASWKTQYYLTVQTDYGTPSGEGWKDAGATANAHLDTGTVAGGTGVQFVYTNWSGDSTGTNYAASDNILMNGPKTATA
ncbi:MAG: InlB B-repeat-containing protein, partial [Candidatus Thorarchaeota archaeon]